MHNTFLGLVALLVVTIQAWKYPYLPVLDLKTLLPVGGPVNLDATLAYLRSDGILPSVGHVTANASLVPRDDTHYYSFVFTNGGCSGTPVYGSYDRPADGAGTTCVNTVGDNAWDSLVTNLGPGYDLYLYAGRDCCTTGDVTPCTIYKGPLDHECMRSAGPNSNTGNHFIQSLKVVQHAYKGANGPANQQTCGVANGDLRCPECSSASKPKKRNAPVAARSTQNAALEACEQAPNCELYFDEDLGHNAIRFKDNMGPESDWYRERVESDNQSLVKRAGDPSCEETDDGNHYYAARSRQTVNFGNMSPFRVIDTMKANCLSNGCDNIEWDVETTYNDTITEIGSCGSVKKRQTGGPVKCPIERSGKVHVKASGQWLPSEKNNFIQALEANGKRSSRYAYDFEDVSGDRDYVYKMSKYININRFVPPNRQGGSPTLMGYASLAFSRVVDKNDACAFVTGLLEAAVGEVSSIGGFFFGQAAENGLTCEG